MRTRPFQQIDVFTHVPYRGNPLAVVLDGAGLTTEQMQHSTDWTNLSEATFLLPPTPEGARAGARRPPLPGLRLHAVVVAITIFAAIILHTPILYQPPPIVLIVTLSIVIISYRK